MQHITRDSMEDIHLIIYKDGQAVQADDNLVIVDIYDADKNELLAGGEQQLEASYNEVDQKYSFQLTSNITGINRTLMVQWRYTLDDIFSRQTDYYSVETPYASSDDIVDFLGFGTSPADANYVEEQKIAVAEKMARTIINGYTGQKFGKYYGSQEQTGKGSDGINLVEKMLTINKVWENDVLVIDNTQDPVFNNFGFPVELSPTGKVARITNAGWDVRYDNQLDPTIMYYGKFRDNTRYKFEGQIGWLYVPHDIKLAAMLLVNDILSNDFNWRNKYLKKVDLSEISFEMAKGAFNGTGNIMVDNILDQYRNVNIMII